MSVTELLTGAYLRTFAGMVVGVWVLVTAARLFRPQWDARQMGVLCGLALSLLVFVRPPWGAWTDMLDMVLLSILNGLAVGLMAFGASQLGGLVAGLGKTPEAFVFGQPPKRQWRDTLRPW